MPKANPIDTIKRAAADFPAVAKKSAEDTKAEKQAETRKFFLETVDLVLTRAAEHLKAAIESQAAKIEEGNGVLRDEKGRVQKPKTVFTSDGADWSDQMVHWLVKGIAQDPLFNWGEGTPFAYAKAGHISIENSQLKMGAYDAPVSVSLQEIRDLKGFGEVLKLGKELGVSTTVNFTAEVYTGRTDDELRPISDYISREIRDAVADGQKGTIKKVKVTLDLEKPFDGKLYPKTLPAAKKPKATVQAPKAA